MTELAVSKKRIDVAVAIVQRPDGTVLWGNRPEGKPYAGYWEFPGGKVEPGETVWHALVRELHEELGITALAGGPWFVIEHDYEHAHVRLHLWRVWRFEGQPQSLEGQRWAWDSLQPQDLTPILPATAPLLSKLAQPTLLAYSQFDALGVEDFLALLDAAPACQLVFREFSHSAERIEQAMHAALKWALSCRGRVLFHASSLLHAQGLGVNWQAIALQHGVTQLELHLPEQLLLQGGYTALAAGSSSLSLVARGASVHSPQALAAAHAQGLDYAVLGAVKPTASHPGQLGMGWPTFKTVAADARLPVYAIGGLVPADLNTAMEHGAHGLAMISGLKDFG